MSIREAILKAADHIESRPRDFNFGSVLVPHSCGTPGCALGWIGYFSSECKRGETIESAYREDHPVAVLGLSSQADFYRRMDSMRETHGHRGWRTSASDCARLMRFYADKYHPAESHSLIPDSVRAIFTMTPQELAREFERI